MIIQVMPESVAEEAELKAGDRIVKIGDRECKSHSDVMAMTAMSRAGDELTIRVKRGDDTFERSIKLAKVDPQPTTAFRYTPAAPVMDQRLLQLKDGKLVPMNNPDVEFRLKAPRVMFGNLQVERSKLEESLKKLESEKQEQDEMIKRLREKISAMETEGAESLEKKFREELERFQKAIQEIGEQSQDEKPEE